MESSSTALAPVARRFDPTAVRRDFPALAQRIHGRPLAYLDNAATTHKPRAVLAAMARFYERDNANVHRALHTLAARATRAYEDARATVQRFLGAAEPAEIVFTRGTTEAINLVAASWGRATLRPGDEVLITEMEHHANIVPWQLVCRATGAVLRAAPVDDRGALRLDALARMLGPRTRMVALAHVSNVLGTVTPVRAVADLAHAHGATVLVDGAMAVAQLDVDVRALGCDFYACSGHKLYGPTGIGVLYGRRALLEAMPPWQGGGEMVRAVSLEDAEPAPPPYRFEAGTPPIAAAVGLAAAIDYLATLDGPGRHAHARDLTAYAAAALAEVADLRLVGTVPGKIGVHAFVLGGVHPHDVATVCDEEGVAIRTGHLCAQPLLARFGLTAVARASLACYSTRADVDRLVAALQTAQRLVG